MNMRYYGTRAAAATHALFASWGWDDARLAAEGLLVVAQDSFNHYRREQFAGATLVVDGGVCEVGDDGLGLYLELVNLADGERAATFLTRPVLMDRRTRTPRAMPGALLERARSAIVDVPPHGQPRSIDLTPPRVDVRYEAVKDRVRHAFSPMLGRQAVRVPESECDEFGFLNLTCAQDIMFSAFAVMARAAGMRMGPPIEKGPDGRRIGWAMLENRQFLVATPRANAPIVTLHAPTRIGAKTQQMRRWTFDTDSGALLSVIDAVSLAFDLDARKATEIPAYMREDLEAMMLDDSTC
jgi:acyl-CoA thioesterase FadM